MIAEHGNAALNSTQCKTRVAVIFYRLGPYHFARLRAAGRQMSLVAIETSGVDETYAWDSIDGADGFERKTVFQHADALKQPSHQVAQRMREALDEISPQVVVIPGWIGAASLGALQWCLQYNIPVVVMSESTEWDETRSPWREAVKRRVVNLCSAALVGGQPHKDYITKLGMPSERVFLGYDAVDNDYFADKSIEVRGQKPEIREKYELPQNYFLASARFIEKKNLPRLLNAYAKYRTYAEDTGIPKAQKTGSDINCRLSSSSPWHLVLLGDGSLRSDLCHLISSLQLQQSVHLPGFIQYPDLPAYYGLANAFIHSSTTEQWGLVVNEAMASGLPVLVSNRCGCAQDLVQEGVNGFTFEPYDVEQLAQLMLQISDSRFPLSDFGEASHKIISDWGTERFTNGLQAATGCATQVDLKSVGVLDQMLLSLLVRK